MELIDRAVDLLVLRLLRPFILILATAIFVIVTMAVFMRYVLGTSFSWTEEVPRYLLIWISFLGAAVGVQRGEHIAFDLLYKSLPPKPRLVLFWILNLLVLGFGWIMLRYGIVFVEEFGSDLMETIPYTNYWYYPAMPISGGLIMLFAAQSLVRSIVRGGDVGLVGDEQMGVD
jgi:TRAP-type C4-dicarboxylate transport system permease small subunit